MTRIGDHAVVLGGSMAGILTARALADRYARVTVVDRDRFPAAGMRRRGVPQDRHIHALQTRGKRAIDDLFPGASDELVARGASTGDWARDATMCFGGHRLHEADAGLEMLTVSRPLLEGHLRDRLARLANVSFRERCDVRGLVLDPNRSVVTGVRVLRREDGAAEELLSADLVVDATGRGSRLPQWLEAVGYPPPRADETGLEVTYTTCRYPRLPSDHKRAIIVSAVPPHGRRGGGAIAVEGDSWVVTLGGVLGEQAPTDRDGFVGFAATLAIPDIHELIRDREPLSEPVLMRYATGRRRRYDLLERFPEGLVVTGDALCSFNPVYGQGMSVAAVEAQELGRCLDDGAQAIGRRFLDAVSTVVGDAWEMAASGDARYVARDDGRSWASRVLGRYQARLLEVASRDPQVATAFHEVMTMTARPPSLARPSVALRVLRGSIPWRGTSRATQQPEVSPARIE